MAEKPEKEQDLEQLRARVLAAEALVVSGFYEEEVPQFTQGVPVHVLQSAVTAEEVTAYVTRITKLQEALRYWMPDETMLKPEELAAWNEHIKLLGGRGKRV